MNIGKLTNRELEDLILSKYKNIRKEVRSTPQIGVDCAYIEIGGTCVVSADPITSATKGIGYLTVHVNCNDAAAAGAEPVGMTVTLLAPPTATKEQISQVADEIAEAAVMANIDIVGGHTEITDAVTRIITSATIIAKPIAKLSNRLCEGDSIIMTKWAGIEATCILAQDCVQKLNLTQEQLTKARSMSKYLSVVPEGVFAAKNGAIAMHDITEGGVLGAVWELCQVSNVGCTVYMNRIPLPNITREMCVQLNINPYRLLSSGSMLIACNNPNEMIDGLEKIGIPATVIARVGGDDVVDSEGNIIAPPGADELYKVI